MKAIFNRHFNLEAVLRGDSGYNIFDSKRNFAFLECQENKGIISSFWDLGGMHIGFDKSKKRFFVYFIKYEYYEGWTDYKLLKKASFKFVSPKNALLKLKKLTETLENLCGRG